MSEDIHDYPIGDIKHTKIQASEFIGLFTKADDTALETKIPRLCMSQFFEDTDWPTDENETTATEKLISELYL